MGDSFLAFGDFSAIPTTEREGSFPPDSPPAHAHSQLFPFIFASDWGHRLKVSVAEDTPRLGLRTQVVWTGSALEASFLQSSFHSSRKCYVSCQVQEVIKQSHLVETCMNHGSDEHGMIFLKVLQ